MDKEQFLIIVNKETKQELNGDDVKTVIQEFCKENPKYSQYCDIVDNCIYQVLRLGMWEGYYNEAKHYFLVKYGVNSCYSNSGQLLYYY